LRTTKSARQTFPRWHLVQAEAPASPRGSVPSAARRTAKVIPFPTAAARGRTVVTYPHALVLPARQAGAPEPTPVLGRLASGSGLVGAALAALVALLLG
jgi:hypothetical protein